MLSDEQMSKKLSFSLLNDEQMSNWVGVKHLPVLGIIVICPDVLYIYMLWMEAYSIF